jgi:hypothetical protein
MIVQVIDDVISAPDLYVDQLLSMDFIDFYDGKNIFKNVLPLPKYDEFSHIVASIFSDLHPVYNFARMSPLGQQEPNFIHDDSNMGLITAILYLSKTHPDSDGTTLYDNEDKPSCIVRSKFNRAVIFDSSIRHSRNIFENFGSGTDSRLIQVCFLDKKNTDE